MFLASFPCFSAVSEHKWDSETFSFNNKLVVCFFGLLREAALLKNVVDMFYMFGLECLKDSLTFTESHNELAW